MQHRFYRFNDATRTQESLGLMPRTLAADAAYGSGLMLGEWDAASNRISPSSIMRINRRVRSWYMDWDQAVAVSLVHQNSVPSVQMHRRIPAILRAMATRAFFDSWEIPKQSQRDSMQHVVDSRSGQDGGDRDYTPRSEYFAVAGGGGADG
jgi:hypothetical protein